VYQGAYERVVKKIYRKYNLEASGINIETIFSRMKPGQKFKVKQRCTNSSLKGIEEHLFAGILRCAALRQLMACAEGLELTNSLTEGTPAQQHVMRLKKTHLKNGTTDNSFGNLGWRYWKNVCR
jgi:hypothetical protein